MVMSHPVSFVDVDSMRSGVSRLNEMVTTWSQMIDRIRSCRAWVPQMEEDFTPGAKETLELRLRAAHTLASEITVDAADVMTYIQCVLDRVQTTDAYIPPAIEPPKTVRPPENESAPEYKVLRTWKEYGHEEGVDWTDNYEEREYPPGTSGGQYQLWKNGRPVEDTTPKHNMPLAWLDSAQSSKKANLAKLSMLIA
jgi:hypothetical protein